MQHSVTVVYVANWVAIHERNSDGSRKYKYIINKGSSRSSKTYSLIDIADAYARRYSNKRGTIWRDTKTDCKKTILRDALKHHKNTGRYQKGYIFNKTESIFHYENDSDVEIHGTDDEETVHGLTQDWAWLNEPYKISRDTFDQIDQRTSDFILIDYNPKKDHWVDDLMKLDNAIVIHSTYKDNPFCPPEQKKKIESYQPLEMCQVVENKLLSEFDALKYNISENPLHFKEDDLQELKRCIYNSETNTANKYKWEVYGLGNKAEIPNRIFHFNEISIQEYLNINANVFYGVDWGAVDPMGIIEAKYYDGALYINELSYKCENDLKKELSNTELSQIRKEEDEGFIIWYFNKLGIDKTKLMVCDNNRPQKIISLRKSGYNAIATRKWKGSVVDGIDLLNNLQVYYTTTSKNLKEEQENYTRQTDKVTGKALEEPIDANNHLLDPIRYIAIYLQEVGIIKVV